MVRFGAVDATANELPEAGQSPASASVKGSPGKSPSSPKTCKEAQERAAFITLSCAAFTRARSCWFKKAGRAMAASTPRIITTISSSMSVNPSVGSWAACGSSSDEICLLFFLRAVQRRIVEIAVRQMLDAMSFARKSVMLDLISHKKRRRLLRLSMIDCFK